MHMHLHHIYTEFTAKNMFKWHYIILFFYTPHRTVEKKRIITDKVEETVCMRQTVRLNASTRFWLASISIHWIQESKYAEAHLRSIPRTHTLNAGGLIAQRRGKRDNCVWYEITMRPSYAARWLFAECKIGDLNVCSWVNDLAVWWSRSPRFKADLIAVCCLAPDTRTPDPSPVIKHNTDTARKKKAEGGSAPQSSVPQFSFSDA